MTNSTNGLSLHTEPPPLRVDVGGAVRVGNSRISLDLIVEQYENGITPEDMVRSHDTLALADVYAVIAYYLRHRDEVRAYLKRREEEAGALRAKIEEDRPCASREELLARRNAREKAYDVATIRREYNQAYAPWSEQDDVYLRCRFLEGATIDDLACEFGRQPGGIRSRLRKLGFDPRDAGRRRVVASGAPSAVPETGSATQNWRELRPRAGRAWSPEDDERLLREYEAGSPLEAIAQSLGRGVFSVEVRLCKLGRIPCSRSL